MGVLRPFCDAHRRQFFEKILWISSWITGGKLLKLSIRRGEGSVAGRVTEFPRTGGLREGGR